MLGIARLIAFISFSIFLSDCQERSVAYNPGDRAATTPEIPAQEKKEQDDIITENTSDNTTENATEKSKEIMSGTVAESKNGTVRPELKEIVDPQTLRKMPAFNMLSCNAPSAANPSGPYLIKNPQSSAFKIESAHFVARWNPRDGVTVAEPKIRAALDLFEKYRTFFLEKVRFSPHYLNRSTKYKVSVNLSDQGYATGGGTGDIDPELWLNQDALESKSTLAHELAHTLQYSSRGLRDSTYVGWAWESHAEWMSFQAEPADDYCNEVLINMPQLHYMSTENRYCNWLFWEYLKDNSCYQTVNDIWNKSKKPEERDHLLEDPLKILARNQNWTTEQLNTVFADWAMHNVTLDYKNGPLLLKDIRAIDDVSRPIQRLRISKLQKIEEKVFAIPEFLAPQPWGYNVVKLHPDKAAKSINLKFKGIVQAKPQQTQFGTYAGLPDTIPNPNSDWRWGVLAVEASGKRRYSQIIGSAKGEMNFELKPGDVSVWLVVMGTPTETQPIIRAQAYYTIYRFPWMMRIDGALPEGHQPNAPKPTERGQYHPNGGGWVAEGAIVDATAYVGPHAMVLGGELRDRARLEDHAILALGTVSGNAVLGGAGIMWQQSATLTDNAVYKSAAPFVNSFTVGGNARVLGGAWIFADITRGIFYDTIDEEQSTDRAFGAERTTLSGEVTAPVRYSWP